MRSCTRLGRTATSESDFQSLGWPLVHVFSITLTAGSTHSIYSDGEVVAAVCMVDSRDTEAAREKAIARLGELGWAEAAFGTTVLLAERADTSSFTDVMREAFADAQRLGVSLIEYPEPNDSA